MILFAKIVGGILVLIGLVSFIAMIPSYRAFKSEDTRFFLTPNEMDEKGDPSEPVPIDNAKFFRLFFIPSLLILIAGIIVLIVSA